MGLAQKTQLLLHWDFLWRIFRVNVLRQSPGTQCAIVYISSKHDTSLSLSGQNCSPSPCPGASLYY